MTEVCNIITGEKIQLLCDHFLGDEPTLRFNPLIWNHYQERCLIMDRIHQPFANGKNVFVYAHHLENLEVLINCLSHFTHAFNLIVHNSDCSFDGRHLVLFDRLKNLKQVFAQNLDMDTETARKLPVYPIPMGLANRMWPHGDLQILSDILKKPLKKTKLVFFNFSIWTNSGERNDCFSKISSKGIPFLPNAGYREYLENLALHRYCIVPRGNAIDTHRFWECLYLRVVPICKKNRLIDYYLQREHVPIIVLDDWADFDINALENCEPNWDGIQQLVNLDWIQKRLEAPLPVTDLDTEPVSQSQS